MGISKRKLKAQTKLKDEELRETLVKAARQAPDVPKEDLFVTNKKSDNLKKRREKLRSDRFKQIKEATTSKVDEKLIKRNIEKLERTGRDKFNEEPAESGFGSKKKIDDNIFGGQLEDIWGGPQAGLVGGKSKKFDKWKNVSSKKKEVKVRAVVLPKGGQSYNPSANDHKKQLKEVADKEQEEVQKRVESLKKVRPSLFEDQNSDDEE